MRVNAEFTQSTTPGRARKFDTNRSGSACLCPVDLTETLTGQPRIADGGVFGLEADGGMPAVVGVSGTLVEAISASSTSGACACALPCAAGFSFLSQ